MGCDMLQPHAFTAVPDHAPYQILRDTLAPYFPSLGDGTKDLSFRNPSRCDPPIKCLLHPLRNRNGANSSALADQIHDGPVVLAGLDFVGLQPDKFGTT